MMINLINYIFIDLKKSFKFDKIVY